MLSPKLQEAINNQINLEFSSAYIYLDMSSFCSDIGLNGSAHWLMMQYKEEMIHAMKFYDYMMNQSAKVVLQNIPAPNENYNNLLDVFTNVLKHEQVVTQSLNELSSLALESKDHATYNFLQWYVTEQIEEESIANDIICKIKLVGDGHGLFMIDNELATRTLPVEPTK